MDDLPDARRVLTQNDFVGFVRDLVTSLDRALEEPEPEPYVDERGGWTNWSNRWSFWEAMTGWLEDSGCMDDLRNEPIAGILLEPVEEPTGEAWNDSDGLRSHLLSVESWASDPPELGSPQMWKRAAQAMIRGAVYE